MTEARPLRIKNGQFFSRGGRGLDALYDQDR